MDYLKRLNFAIWKFRHQFSPVTDYDFSSDGEILHQYTPIRWTVSSYISLAVSTVVGIIIGIFISLVLNATIVELCLSPAFSVYFGIFLVILSLLILKRVLDSDVNVVLHPEEQRKYRGPRNYLIAFAALNTVIGVACLCLQMDYIILLCTSLRILCYTFLGMSICFASAYAIVDLLNIFVGLCRIPLSRPLVDSVLQIYVVVISSLCMGASFGFIFGIVDFDDSLLNIMLYPHTYNGERGVHLISMVDTYLCIITGSFWGGLTGLANEYIRRVELAYNCIDQPVEFESDI